MHDWAAVNGWSRPSTKASKKEVTLNGWSRPSTEASQPSRQSRPSTKADGLTVSITGLKPVSGLRRSNTTVERGQGYKPIKRFCESYRSDYIRYLEITNKESEIKLKETPFTWSSVQRSTSEIDTHNTPRSTGGSVLSGGLLRERSQAFVSPASEAARRESLTQGNKQEMKMVVAGVPKKGLISLSTMNDLPPKKESHREDRRRLGAYTHVEQNSSPKSSLIKRKEILDHMKIGFKLMEDAEEVKHKEEAMKKSLVDYTLFDLQTNLMELTDAKSIRRRAAVTQEISTQKLPAQKPKPKEFQLPAIQIFNPFLTMKSM